MSLPTSRRIELRHRLMWAIRQWLVADRFVEVDTALLVDAPGLEPFLDPLPVSVRNAFDHSVQERWLITSPELALKRVLSTGLPRIFQLSHVFRDGEKTKRHCPEFTLLEHYRSPGTLDDMKRDLEKLCVVACDALDLPAPKTPFREVTVAELFQDHAGLNLRVHVDNHMHRVDTLVDAVRACGIHLRDGADFDDAFVAVMDQLIEPKLAHDGPVIVTRWPAPMAVLARTCDDDALFAERFEIYVRNRFGVLELCNAFDELTDSAEQRRRFHADNAKRQRMHKPILPIDEEFLSALDRLDRAAGCATGIDRLLMWLCDVERIDDVLPLPWR